MGHNVRHESPVFRDSGLTDKRKSLQRQIMVERQKLESLIVKQYERGVCNLGLDIGVLKQSNTLDGLLLEIMMLEDNDKKS